jgi:hypothetical protein
MAKQRPKPDRPRAVRLSLGWAADKTIHKKVAQKA